MHCHQLTGGALEYQKKGTLKGIFLAALAALYLTLVSESVTEWVGATLEFLHKE